MPRLFSGLKIPPSIAQHLIMLQSGLKNIRWIEPENYHITLRFIGDVDNITASEFNSALDQIRFKPFTLKLKGVGSFGSKKPRTLWAGIGPSAPLLSLQKQHERAAIAVGLEPERRKFAPHMTLARPINISAGHIEQYKFIHNLFESPEFEVSHFQLFSARSGYGGGPYLVEGNYPEHYHSKDTVGLAEEFS